jgi:two-component system, OmpR family, phosphate regulon sensor histidine kinase PhoR
MIRRDPSKALLIGFLTLLVVSTIQIVVWMTDHIRYTGAVQQQLNALYRADAEVVSDFLRGRAPENLEREMPHLDVDADARNARVRPAALEELARDTASRSNRYFWEGTFFLVVLIGGMAVLTRALRHDSALRQRQQNFLAAVSHEFKSPLASVRLAAETLVMRSTEPDTQRLGRRILEDGERLLRMVDNLLDTTRLEEGRQALTPGSVSVRAAVEAAVAEVAERAALNRIDIAIDVDESLRLYVDPSALDTMLRNLLDNSVKSCVAGDGHSITVRAVHANGRVALGVTDDGLGFPPEDAAMIFEKFHRLGDELRRSTAGTGLGLYIVRRLVELSGAAIRATSEGPGNGATVTITWPERALR